MSPPIEFTLPIPPTVNNLFPTSRTGRRYKSAEYTRWLTEAGWELKRQQPGHQAGQVRLIYLVPENPRRDLANHEKPLSDLLVKHGVIEDDRKVRALIMLYDDNRKDVMVKVQPYFEGPNE